MARKPRSLPPGVMLKSQYAAHRGVAPSRITALIQQGKLRAPALRPDGTVDVAQADLMLGPSQGQLESSLVANEAEAAAFAESRARHEAAKAELAELQLAQKRSELIDREEAERAFEEIARGLRERLLQLPRQVAGDLARLGEEGSIAAHLMLAIRRVLDETHDGLRRAA